jgi:hypothetical protein
MNKTMRGLCFLALTISLISCLPRGGGFMIFADDQSIFEKQIKLMIKSIESKDSEGLRSLFSKNALDNIENFDETAERLFSFIQGTVKNPEQTSFNRSYSRDYGTKTSRIYSKYKISTEKDIYRFHFIYYAQDTTHPENIGMHTIRVVRFDEEDDFFAYFQDMEKIPGITVLSKSQN